MAIGHKRFAPKNPWAHVRVVAVVLLVSAFLVVRWTLPAATESSVRSKEGHVDLDDLRQHFSASPTSLNATLSTVPHDVQREIHTRGGVEETYGPLIARMAKKRAKIFVYDLPSKFTDLVVVRNPRCEREAFGTEIHIHKQLLRSKYRTLNPDDADLFYVPVYAACVVYTNFRHFPAYRRLISDSLSHVMHNHPYWNRSKGQDHIFAFVHDYGACLSWFDNLNHVYFKELQNSIFLSHLGDLSMGCFSPQRDIVIPPMSANENVFRLGRGGAKQPQPKSTFAYFRGTVKWYHEVDIPELKITRGYSKSYSKGIRLEIMRLFQNDPLFMINEGPSNDYVNEVRNSTFCLCPRGFAPWSQRLYDSIMLGCIPVIIADDIVLPWENLVDYRKFSVKVDESELPRLKHILLAISNETIAAKQTEMRKVYKMFSYQRPSEPGDAFDTLLLQLSMKVMTNRPAGPNAWG